MFSTERISDSRKAGNIMITKKILIKDHNHIKDEDLMEAAQIIRQGGLVAFPTETVYGLGANALDDGAAKRIYAAKGRPSDNPLIAHVSSIEEVNALVSDVPDTARKLMEAFWPGPLTLVFRKSDVVPYETTGGLDTVAVRMPGDLAARRLIALAGVPVAAPSANTSGRPSPTLASHVLQDLDGKIEMVIDGGAVGIGLESTIVDVSGSEPVLLRPGAVTVEMLEGILGKILIDPVILGPVSDDRKPKAPGMKYRHYAPQAQLWLVEGELNQVVDKIKILTEEKIKDGAAVGIICTEETKDRYRQGIIRSLGDRSREDAIAHNLFGVLREFDDLNVDYIYSESFSGDHLGQAIMNRLMKAAGYQVIYAQKNCAEMRKIMTQKRKDYISWDEYFIGVAYMSGMRSKDPSTQVGACIVSKDNKILSMGYNGFPIGCSDDEFPWGKEGDDPYDAKYLYSAHSELNAILNYRGGSLEGSKIYVTLFPCNECAKAIIQAGIKQVIYANDKYADTPAVRASKRMMDAAGVEYIQYQATGRKISIEV